MHTDFPVTMDVKGLDELEWQLIAFGEKVDTKVLREALKVVEENMKQHTVFVDESSAEQGIYSVLLLTDAPYLCRRDQCHGQQSSRDIKPFLDAPTI